jgi:hypothetical protein
MNDCVLDILKGSYDLQVHVGLDPIHEGRMDALDCSRHSYESGLAGFVFKSDEYPTSSSAFMLNKIYPGLKIIGSITLNKSVGGLNPDALVSAARTGAKIVWMPTNDANNFTTSQEGMEGIGVVDAEGSLLPDVHTILSLVKEYDLVLASGYISPKETYILFKAGAKLGIDKMIVTDYDTRSLSYSDQENLSSLGVFIEYTLKTCMPSMAPKLRNNFTDMVRNIRRYGVEHCVVSSGLGQWTNPPPAEGLRMLIAGLLQGGLEPEKVSALVKSNPKYLLNV